MMWAPATFLALDVAPDYRENGRGGGANVRADDRCGCAFKVDDAGHGSSKDQGHGRAGALHDQGEQEPDGQEGDDVEDIAEIEGRQVEGRFYQVKGRLQGLDAEKEDAEAHHRVADVLATAVFTDEGENGSQAYERQGQGLDLHAHTNRGHDPAGDRGADVASEDHAHRLGHGHQPRVDEPDGSHGDGAGGLHQRCDHETGEEAPQWGFGPCPQDVAQGGARGVAQTVGHQPHADQEEAESAEDSGKRCKGHARSGPCCMRVDVTSIRSNLKDVVTDADQSRVRRYRLSPTMTTTVQKMRMGHTCGMDSASPLPLSRMPRIRRR